MFGEINYSFKPAPKEILVVQHNNADVIFTFMSEENGKEVTLELHPESNITALESLQITKLIASVTNQAMYHHQILPFVRHHALERHFKIREK